MGYGSCTVLPVAALCSHWEVLFVYLGPSLVPSFASRSVPFDRITSIIIQGSKGFIVSDTVRASLQPNYRCGDPRSRVLLG